MSGNSKSFVSTKNLPKINGMAIDGVYSQYCEVKERYQNQYADDTNYYKLSARYANNTYSDDKDQLVKVLPDVFKKIFDTKVINGMQIKRIDSMWIRTSDSANGSFDDQTISLSCVTTNGNFFHPALYLGFPYKKDALHMIDPESELGLHMTAMVSADSREHKISSLLAVDVLPDWYGTVFPQTFLRNEGGVNYPDAEREHWRSQCGSPYVTYDGKENIRVYDDNIKAHVYLTKVKSVELDDDNLVMVDFAYDSDKRDKFCFIHSWRSDHSYINYKITRKRGKQMTISTMRNGEVQGKKVYTHLPSFYRVVRTMYIN